ncbi:uncharacterized protein [Haliotis cracherodii]|uniref:uncharacterized protein n=1 Tax=Haliotis cracherodii TaxID=6455 RepID=UPI0039EB85FE
MPIEARKRYETKLKYRQGTCTLPDPYCLRNGWVDDPTTWPGISFTDIYFYLIDTPGQFTHESMRAYKSLKAYEYVESGHVFPIQYHNVDDKSPLCLMRTKVIPSQRLRDKPHQPWVCVDKANGTVYCAHCTCMAGLGEVCSHIAALLFKVDLAVRAGLTSKACTSDACKWNSAYRKELHPSPISEVQSLFCGRRKQEVKTVSATGRAPLPDLDVLRSLKEICPDAVFFKTIPPLDEEETDSADEDEDMESFPPSLTSLCHDLATDEDLVSICEKKWNDYNCEPAQIQNLEEVTRNQAISPLWYEHRKGRITGTKAHDILVMKDTTDPTNTIKRIMGYSSRDLTKIKAVAWGIDNEDKARICYSMHQSRQHVNFRCRRAGVLICASKPCIGASSDGTVFCDCCGKGCIEIKCPYKHRDTDITTAAQDKGFCLNGDLMLKTGHKYYTQVQLQMYVHNVTYCDFVVFSNVDMVIARIPRDSSFCSKLVTNCENFFLKHVLPEIISRKIEKARPNTECDNEEAEHAENNVWCLCQQEEYGPMIMCEGANCSYTWFHYPCVSIRRKPKGTWLCPSCVMG